MLVAGRAIQNCLFVEVFAARLRILGIDSWDSGRVATLRFGVGASCGKIH